MANSGEIKGRIPPHSIEAETAVLGAVLLSNAALDTALESLRPEDFYTEAHRFIFQAMVELSTDAQPVDLVTLAERLKANGRLKTVGGAVYLAQLADAVQSAAHVAHYARIVKDYALARSLIDRATSIIARGFEPGADVELLLDEAEQAIFDLAETKIKPSFHSLAELVKDSFKRIEQLSENKGLVTGVPTGFAELDRLLAGLQPSDLIIVAGRPSMGKTALALNIAVHAAARASVPVGVFSLEMSKEQLATRMLCSEARVNASKLRTGYLSDRDWGPLTEAAGILSSAKIFVDDTPGLDILEMRAKARRLKREHDLGLIVVDYLQLMQSRGRAESREREISDISRSLKAMAKELNLPVLALSQLNRKVEDRPGGNRRPQLADLRESGAIEQDADVIIFIYRDEVYNKAEDNPEKGKAEIIVGKHRNGATGVVKLAFAGKFTRFDDLDEAHEAFAPPSEADSAADAPF